MAEAYEKGKAYEMHIAKLVRRKADKGTTRNKGSHANSHRRSDVYTNLPIHIEAKHHENIRVKEWMEQAEAAKSFSETAVVAFRIEEEDYACLKFNDLLDLFVQIADLEAEVKDLHEPIEQTKTVKPRKANVSKEDYTKLAKAAADKKVESGTVKTCRNGHICDQFGYCQQKQCKFNRFYKAPKAKKGRK